MRFTGRAKIFLMKLKCEAKVCWSPYQPSVSTLSRARSYFGLLGGMSNGPFLTGTIIDW